MPSFFELRWLYGIGHSQVTWTIAIPALGLAVGSLLWSSLADTFGRRIVFLVGTVVALAATIGAAEAKSYDGYMAARFFQGFGVSPAATVGLAIINEYVRSDKSTRPLRRRLAPCPGPASASAADVFSPDSLSFEHERGRRVCQWVVALHMGLDDVVGGLIGLVGPAWVQRLPVILFGLLLLVELAFLTETLYPRSRMLTSMPRVANGSVTIEMEEAGPATGKPAEVADRRTANLPFLQLRPVPGVRHPKPWDSLVRFVWTFRFLVESLPVFMYCYAWHWWMLSVIAVIPAAYVKDSPQVPSVRFVGLIVGTLFGHVVFSGWPGDFIVAPTHGGVRVPERRLWLAYLGALPSAGACRSFPSSAAAADTAARSA